MKAMTRSQRLEFRHATPSDIEYVVHNLRRSDHEELFCQMVEGAGPNKLVNYLTAANDSTACILDGKAVALFGLSEINAVTMAVNLFGTNSITRAVPEITRYIFSNLLAGAVGRGFRRFEARSIETHTTAHHWLKACGAVCEGELRQMGRNGETFLMFALTSDTIQTQQPKRWMQ